ncbi:aromatic acid exporter family protein [Paenibacillus sp. GP183]|uniref:aromatic acid exporter family protein n=1 Tax=Paenibacillus sp. GP183 TaxID=1882751 RepID=UPI0008951F91|nr:aromatic acid exporter family protein [Paenibacillus sp. GP183]SEB60041.1 Uncharacterized membrane protein YgaE, UPF0421/DUF939 family [Paenibacillus sp. GP183]
MGFRVIKTALAAVAAIYISEWIGLTSPISAGLLAILGVEVTKRKGIDSALKRIAASVFALLFGIMLLSLFGFHIWLIGIFVCIVFPLLHRLRLSEGVVTGSVVMFHIYSRGIINLQGVWNEIQLLIIGLGTATLINIAYMPKLDKAILAQKVRVEQLFSQIFVHIAHHLRDHSIVWDGREILEAHEAVKQGSELAKQTLDNSLVFGAETYWSVYFYMRGEQLESIERMTALVAQVYENLPQGEWIASLFDSLSEDVKNEYYTGHTEKLLSSLEARFKKMPLPESRVEFEVRSAMLQLDTELMHFLSIAKKQKKQKPEMS